MFTPPDWAAWALDQLAAVAALEAGATVCDPTAGEGAFILALARQYRKEYGSLPPAVLRRIFLIDREPRFLEGFHRRFRGEFGVNFPASNAVCADIIETNPGWKFDVVVGNPPWVNFSDLGSGPKERLKPWFVRTGLVPDLRKVLLGGARIDLAALVLARVFAENTKPGSRLGFFLPLSLFLNEGAHGTFRLLRFGGHGFCLDRVFDFQGLRVFDGVTTRFCWAEFTRGRPTRWPVDYFTRGGEGWNRQFAAPVGPGGAPLAVSAEPDPGAADLPRITVAPWQVPRQGINTGGANGVFHFDAVPPGMDPAYFHPLVTAKVLSGETETPEKFILLPYHPTGKPLDGSELDAAGLGAYLRLHEERLRLRKGVLLRGAMARGTWWALVGVGPYCFSGYKLVWAAYGAREFRPRILSSWEGRPWQANQAMQAFIPAETWADAERIRTGLGALGAEARLKAQRMEGTCNWAQPGRIRRLVDLSGPDRRRAGGPGDRDPGGRFS